jgi:hypothetical protein
LTHPPVATLVVLHSVQRRTNHRPVLGDRPVLFLPCLEVRRRKNELESSAVLAMNIAAEDIFVGGGHAADTTSTDAWRPPDRN